MDSFPLPENTSAAVFEVFADFIEALRKAEIPVSPIEELELAKALLVIDVTSKDELKYALLATLIKSSAHIEIFEEIFSKFFTPWQKALHEDSPEEKDNRQEANVSIEQNRYLLKDAKGFTPWHSGEVYLQNNRLGISGEEITAIRQLLLEAILTGDYQKMSEAAKAIAAHITGISAEKLVSASYYAALSLRLSGLDEIKNFIMGALSGQKRPHSSSPTDSLSPWDSYLPEMRLRELQELAELGDLGEKLIEKDIDNQLDIFKSLLRSEIDQVMAMLKNNSAFDPDLMKTVGQFEFLRADDLELRLMRKELNPLAKILSSRLRKFSHLGKYQKVNFPATFRKSLATQGVPVRIFYEKTNLSKPEITVIADVSGSVASFARFSLHLISAIAEEFSKVNSFVFIDEVINVTKEMKRRSLLNANVIEDVIAQAERVSLKGHSDYGYAFEEFISTYLKQAVSKRSVILLLGDARTNYHPPRPELLAFIKNKAKALYFLNPEPSAYWNTGDSVVDVYKAVCDNVVECRTLNQLADFIDGLSGRKRSLGAISL